jgi:hypothetical protein
MQPILLPKLSNYLRGYKMNITVLLLKILNFVQNIMVKV